MSLFSLKPVRDAKTSEPVKVIADLDRLIADSIGFKLHGKIHVVKPLSTAQFFKIYDRFVKLEQMQKDIGEKEKPEDLVVDALYEIFHSFADTLTKDDVRELTWTQVNALMSLVMETVQGKTHAEKKNEMTPSV
jgi:hypothetical protein